MQRARLQCRCRSISWHLSWQQLPHFGLKHHSLRYCRLVFVLGRHTAPLASQYTFHRPCGKASVGKATSLAGSTSPHFCWVCARCAEPCQMHIRCPAAASSRRMCWIAESALWLHQLAGRCEAAIGWVLITLQDIPADFRFFIMAIAVEDSPDWWPQNSSTNCTCRYLRSDNTLSGLFSPMVASCSSAAGPAAARDAMCAASD